MADHAAKTGITLSNGTYDVFKQFVEIVLPGVGTLYFTLATLWGLPHAEQVVGTCGAFALFFGLVLKLSRRVYDTQTIYDGHLVTDETDPESPKIRFELSGEVPPEELLAKDQVVFKGLDKA